MFTDTQIVETKSEDDYLKVPETLEIVGLKFRGDQDYAAMLAVIDGSKAADGRDSTETLEDLERSYRHLTNSDPDRDMIFAEIDGEVVGYGRVWWVQIEDGPRVYHQIAFLLPSWRGMGIRQAMLRHNEQRLRELASEHDEDLSKVFEAWTSDAERDWTDLLEEAGYEPVRYGFEMVRSSLNEIPDHPIPQGLEVRPVLPEQVGQIWDAAREAFRDHWGFCEEEWSADQLEGWREDPTFKPELWQVAWDGDEVAGMVLNFINETENEEHDRKRGYTETICVRRPWRRRGLARALIARSMQLHRRLGMTEVALGVDALNPNGALQLYESMGYETVKRYVTYRKPLTDKPSTEKESTDDYDLRSQRRDT